MEEQRATGKKRKGAARRKTGMERIPIPTQDANVGILIQTNRLVGPSISYGENLY